MKKYKGFIIFIIILGIYGLVMFFVFGNKGDNNENTNLNNKNSNKVKENKYLVIDNISNLNYSDGVFSRVKNKEIEKAEKFKVYVNNKYYGDYKLKNVSSWNLFDKNDEFVNYNGDLLAFTDNFNIKVRNNYKIRELDEKDKVYLINNFSLNSFSNLVVNEVVDYDLDDNGVMDQIINISSIDENDNINNNYSIIVLTLNNEKTTLIDERVENAKYVYSIFGIINIDNNEKDSIILTKTEGYISESPKVSSLIYNYKNDKYMID